MSGERDGGKPRQDLEATNLKAPRDGGVGPVAARRQFLKGLITGTVGALPQSGCSPTVPSLQGLKFKPDVDGVKLTLRQ